MSDHPIQRTHPNDIFRWPDGTICYREDEEAGGMRHMSDDFEVIPVNSVEWHRLEAEME